MANTTISPNMGLVVPSVGVDPGPDWANNLNASLSILDSHDHTPGKGVQVTPDGLNINSDLSFIGNNATLLRSTRFAAQSAPLALSADLGCLYVAGLDLYYNDELGNQVRITQSGGLAGTPGSIGGLVPPASVTYIPGNETFVFQSDVNTPANIDVASIIVRNLTMGSNGITLSPPNALASNFTITLPTLPAVGSVLTIDPSGNMGTIPTSSILPIGAITLFGGASTPTGFLSANSGTAVSRTTYSALYAVVGNTYGPGDGSTTFNLPTKNPFADQAFNSTGTSIPSYVHSYWHMDSTGNEPNVVQPSGYNLTMNGLINSVPGKFDLARGFFSNVNYFSWPAASSSSTPYDSLPFAIDGWFNTMSSTEGGIMLKTNGSNGWFIRQNAAGSITFFVDGIAIISPLAYNDSNWHYFAAAVLSSSGANNMRLYIDGSMVAATAGVAMTPSSADFQVGFYSGFTAGYQGYIDDISYWNTVPVSWALFESIVTARWNGGTGNLLGTAVSVPNNYIIKY